MFCLQSFQVRLLFAVGLFIMCVCLILNQPLNLKNVLFLICWVELPMLLVWRVWNIQKSGKNSTLSSDMLGTLHLDVQVVTTSPHLPRFFLSSLTGLGLPCFTPAFLVAVSRSYSSCGVQASLRSLDPRVHGLQKWHTFLLPPFTLLSPLFYPESFVQTM